LVPGVVESGVWSGKTAEEVQSLHEWAAKSLPVRHLGQPTELAEAVIFLITNSYMTGHLLTVDGGLSCT
jgi:NAD(P)-dependent dehydrogenase (short-subunit alcohol dehydrogenase family)